MRAKVIDKLISLVKGGFFIFLTATILLIISCHLDVGSEKVSLGVALEEPFFEQVDMKESLFWNKDIVGSAQCMKGYFDEGTNRLMISVTSKCGNVEDYYQMSTFVSLFKNLILSTKESMSFTLFEVISLTI